MFDWPESHPCLMALLHEAAGALKEKDISGYVCLRNFAKAGMKGDREKFERRFSAYYGLSRWATAEFKSTYFRLLFEHQPHATDDPYTPLLLCLHKIPNQMNRKTVVASFVSKLVALHDDAQPLFDRYVQAFFGIGVPTLNPVEFRIAGFVHNLRQIRRTYEVWSGTPAIADIIDQVRHKHSGLADVHANRICDFLVWATGRRSGTDYPAD